jgi:hypothetical protein
LARAVEAAVASAGVPIPAVAGTTLRRARWGREHDVRVLVADEPGDATAIAAYVAKYATKTADGTAWLAHPVRAAAQIEHLQLRPHVVELVRTAWHLGARQSLGSFRLRAHAHTLGYGGQFSSKSVRYSTTFTALRLARARHARAQEAAEPDYDGEWRYAGRGYGHPEADDLAAALFEAAQSIPRSSRRVPE